MADTHLRPPDHKSKQAGLAIDGSDHAAGLPHSLAKEIISWRSPSSLSTVSLPGWPLYAMVCKYKRRSNAPPSTSGRLSGGLFGSESYDFGFLCVVLVLVVLDQRAVARQFAN